MTIIHTIPTIDISPYLSQASNQETKDKVIEEVRSACATYGFLQVKGHGIPVELQRKMLQCCEVVFDLPTDQKESLSLKNNPVRRQVNRHYVDPHAELRLSQGLRESRRTNFGLYSTA